MGRKRITNLDLPKYVHRKGDGYYFVISDGGNRLWIRLGGDKAKALLRADDLREQYDRDPQDPEMRERAMRRDGFRCVYCGTTSLLGIDHVVPISRGGDNTINNIVVACRTCNSKKSVKHPSAFVEDLQNTNATR